MTDIDHKLRQHMQKESDEIMFGGMELSNQVKQRIRQQASAEKSDRRYRIPRAWITGVAALAAAVVIFVSYSAIQQPRTQVPADNIARNLPTPSDSAIGTELSLLITTILNHVDEVRSAFGEALLIPSEALEGYTLTEMSATSMKGEPARDVIFTYSSSEKSYTFSASRQIAAFPEDLFEPTKVNNVDGFVFEQPTFIELFWIQEGIQYSVMGQISFEEAVQVAESIQL